MNIEKSLSKRRNRSNLDIVADILTVIQNGSRKTRIMYGAYMSFDRLKRYLEWLTRIGLIRNNIDDQTYWASSRGLYFLRVYREFRRYGEAFDRKKEVLINLLQESEGALEGPKATR